MSRVFISNFNEQISGIVLLPRENERNCMVSSLVISMSRFKALFYCSGKMNHIEQP